MPRDVGLPIFRFSVVWHYRSSSKWNFFISNLKWNLKFADSKLQRGAFKDVKTSLEVAAPPPPQKNKHADIVLKECVLSRIKQPIR